MPFRLDMSARGQSKSHIAHTQKEIQHIQGVGDQQICRLTRYLSSVYLIHNLYKHWMIWLWRCR